MDFCFLSLSFYLCFSWKALDKGKKEIGKISNSPLVFPRKYNENYLIFLHLLLIENFRKGLNKKINWTQICSFLHLFSFHLPHIFWVPDGTLEIQTEPIDSPTFSLPPMGSSSFFYKKSSFYSQCIKPNSQLFSCYIINTSYILWFNQDSSLFFFLFSR